MKAVLTVLNKNDYQVFDWGEIRWLTSGALHNAETSTFGRVIIKAGKSNPLHYHSNTEEILHLISGEIDHIVENDIFRLKAGDTLTIPKGARHQAKTLGEEDAVMLVFYPVAERQFSVV